MVSPKLLSVNALKVIDWFDLLTAKLLLDVALLKFEFPACTALTVMVPSTVVETNCEYSFKVATLPAARESVTGNPEVEVATT